MLIVGAKGFAKEVLEVLYQLNQLDNVVFFDDVNNDLPNLLYNRFPILTNEDQVKEYFKNNDNSFTIGIGSPVLRKKMEDKFCSLGGKLVSTISPLARISTFEVAVGKGSNILMNATISNNVSIGKSSIIYFNSVLSHDCILGDYVQISPSATLLGRCKIGSFTFIGANAVILPDVVIGANVIVGAGAIVTKNIPSDVVVAGTPAKFIKNNKPI